MPTDEDTRPYMKILLKSGQVYTEFLDMDEGRSIRDMILNTVDSEVIEFVMTGEDDVDRSVEFTIDEIVAIEVVGGFEQMFEINLGYEENPTIH